MQIGVRDTIDKNKILRVDRTSALDAVKECLIKQEIDLPMNILSVPDFTDQLLTSTRIFDDKSQIYKWVESGPDHYHHAFSYMLKAEKLLHLI